MNLKNGIKQAQSDILLYGITPPHRKNPPEKIGEIAQKTLTRLMPLDIDGLVIYDINDESDRNAEDRPFPYLPTMDPYIYLQDYLKPWTKPTVIYRCVGKYSGTELSSWLQSVEQKDVLTVFVGASSKEQKVKTTLHEAYEMRRKLDSSVPLGGVLIAERHTKHNSEHLRIEEKRAEGCSFFISQIFYNVDYTKSLLSDYYYHCQARGVPMVPVILTTSVCGSPKTLEFMKWLGIHIPRWLENEITHAADPLKESFRQCLQHVDEIIAFCRRHQIPFGFNVESVSNRLVEIEASVELAKEIRKRLK
ncbi:MAG TPA: methylenetetrahydrofolate reductase [Bacillota bacterium]|nr:methylenetetrahydrofolate reductase [Bacillota bacterium]